MASGWTVTAQVTDQVIVTNAGQTVVGTYVYFTTGDGNNGNVFVPDEHYSAKKVRQMVHAKAELIDEIGNLAAEAG